MRAAKATRKRVRSAERKARGGWGFISALGFLKPSSALFAFLTTASISTDTQGIDRLENDVNHVEREGGVVEG